MLLGRAAIFAICKDEAGGGGLGPEMAQPTTEGAGSKDWEAGAGSASRGANKLFGTGGEDTGNNNCIDMGAGVALVDEISPMSRSAHSGTIS